MSFPTVKHRGTLATAPASGGGGGGTGWVGAGMYLSTSSKNSIDPILSTTTLQLNAGNVGICIAAVDNDGDGTDTNDFAGGNVDAANNTYFVGGENEVDPGSAQAGAAVEIIWTKATSNLIAGATMAFDLAAAKGSKAESCYQFTVPVGSTITMMGGLQAGATLEDSIAGTDVGPLTISGLPLGEYLFIRAWATENDTAESPTYTVGWSSFTAAGTTGSTNNTNMQITGEWIIATVTSATSDPTTTIAAMDRASAMIALQQTGP